MLNSPMVVPESPRSPLTVAMATLGTGSTPYSSRKRRHQIRLERPDLRVDAASTPGRFWTRPKQRRIEATSNWRVRSVGLTETTALGAVAFAEDVVEEVEPLTSDDTSWFPVAFEDQRPSS